MNTTFSPAQTAARYAILTLGPAVTAVIAANAAGFDQPGFAVAAAWLWNPWTASIPAALLSSGRQEIGDSLADRARAPFALLARPGWRGYAAASLAGWALVLAASLPGLNQAVALLTS